MTERPREDPSRRELFAGALRYAALGLVATGGAALFAKRRRLLRDGVCINDRLCDGCAIFPQCELPQAMSARKIQSGVNGGGR